MISKRQLILSSSNKCQLYFSFIAVVVICTVTSHILLGPVLIYKKKKLKRLTHPQVLEEGYNNVSSNINLANGIFNVAIIGCFVVVGSTVMLVDWKGNAFVPVLSWYMMAGSMINVIIPTKLIMKSEIRKHIKTHLF